MKNRWRYALSLAAMAGGLSLMSVSPLAGLAVVFVGGIGRLGLEKSINARRRHFGANWLHYAIAGYVVSCCLVALSLAISGYWQQNGLPSRFEFMALASPVLLVAVMEEVHFYRQYIASEES